MKPESKPPLSSHKTAADRADTTADELAPGNAVDAPKEKTIHPAFDATVALDVALTRSTKEERDVALAIAALQLGKINTRQVSRALGNWTIHGHRSLADHLVSQGALTPDDRTQLEKVAVQILAEGDAATTGDLQAHLRDKVGADTWEQICRMLGLVATTEFADTDAPRETLAEYVILRRLGIGGLGSVWLARDQTLGRLVAVKEVNERGAESPAALARFRREAEITGQLEHPNIVPVYQSGQDTKSKLPFYVMRFVGKKTLADAISDYHTRRAAGLADTVELHRLLGAFLSVCQAVAFAHSRNVLHRDLKPENVALGNFGQVIVLDWGLAKRTDDGDWQDSVASSGPGGSTVERTVAGQVLGTPHYMSPEQAAGRVDSMDERTDVYGLGATLFAILTGYAPHEASQVGSTRSARGAELYAAIVDNPTPRCRQTVPEVPAPLDAVCAKAMAAAPAARYPSAAEMAEDIQLWIAGEPVSAYTEPWTSQSSRLFRKHRALSAMLLAIFLAVVVPLGILGYSSNQRRAAAQQARMEALYLDGNGLSVNLEAAVDKGRQNVRFMSRIPPIQGIIRARQPDSTEEDDEQTWRGRLETIYTGLLRANPDYPGDFVRRLGRRRQGDRAGRTEPLRSHLDRRGGRRAHDIRARRRARAQRDDAQFGRRGPFRLGRRRRRSITGDRSLGAAGTDFASGRAHFRRNDWRAVRSRGARGGLGVPAGRVGTRHGRRKRAAGRSLRPGNGRFRTRLGSRLRLAGGHIERLAPGKLRDRSRDGTQSAAHRRASRRPVRHQGTARSSPARKRRHSGRPRRLNPRPVDPGPPTMSEQQTATR